MASCLYQCLYNNTNPEPFACGWSIISNHDDHISDHAKSHMYQQASSESTNSGYNIASEPTGVEREHHMPLPYNVLIDRRRARAQTQGTISHLDRQVSTESITSHYNIVFGATGVEREHKRMVLYRIWIDKCRARASQAIAISCFDKQASSESTTRWVTRTRKRKAARGILGT